MAEKAKLLIKCHDVEQDIKTSGKILKDEIWGPVESSVSNGDKFVSDTDTGKICFSSGSAKGVIYLHKNLMTFLADEVIKSDEICMVDVPASLMLHDLIKFMAPAKGIKSYKMVTRDTCTNQYLVLVKFKNPKYAEGFYSEYNGKVFNNTENKQCSLRYVVGVEGMPEVPNICSICSDRIDKVENITVTLLCNHTCHSSCVNKLTNRCAYCYYFQTRCSNCGLQENLLMCLDCGGVGCKLHAYKHFKEARHTYAILVGQKTVWDYAQECYINLMQTGDGKVVEWDHEDERNMEKKLNLEYYLIFIKLQSERAFYEKRISTIEAANLAEKLELETTLDRTVEKCEENKKLYLKLKEDKLISERTITQLNNEMKKGNKECALQKESNRRLQLNVKDLQDKASELASSLSFQDEKHRKELMDLKKELEARMLSLDDQPSPEGTMVSSASGTSTSKL